MLGPEELRETERIDAMVGGASLGLDLAEELGRLAPFGMGNPGVRLLVPSARVSDVRTMGEGGKHSRFSLHSGSHRALGVAFGRSKLGVGDDDPVDAAVRLEVNHWNGSVEPRVVLRELYPHEADRERRRRARGRGRGVVEALRGRAGRRPRRAPARGRPARRRAAAARGPRRQLAAATIFELLSSGAGVLALVADAPRRAALARDGLALADYAELERQPDLPRGFAHVVLVDPPPSARLERLASQPTEEGGYLHPVWGDAEHRFALAGPRVAPRPAR